MKTDMHFQSYLAHFFSERTMFQAKIRTRVLCSFFFENRTFNEIMWKNIVEPERPCDNIIRLMHMAWCIPKATNTHSQYVTFIVFPLLQWLQAMASL
jgi:hypothetical protein